MCPCLTGEQKLGNSVGAGQSLREEAGGMWWPQLSEPHPKRLPCPFTHLHTGPETPGPASLSTQGRRPRAPAPISTQVQSSRAPAVWTGQPPSRWPGLLVYSRAAGTLLTFRRPTSVPAQAWMSWCLDWRSSKGPWARHTQGSSSRPGGPALPQSMREEEMAAC